MPGRGVLSRHSCGVGGYPAGIGSCPPAHPAALTSPPPWEGTCASSVRSPHSPLHSPQSHVYTSASLVTMPVSLCPMEPPNSTAAPDICWSGHPAKGWVLGPLGRTDGRCLARGGRLLRGRAPVGAPEGRLPGRPQQHPTPQPSPLRLPSSHLPSQHEECPPHTHHSADVMEAQGNQQSRVKGLVIRPALLCRPCCPSEPVSCETEQ